jgi:phosphatidylglycerol:prolipoprotein diacylglycerol transferase
VHPIFLKFTLPLLGEVEFPAYMTMLMLGFTLAIWLARRDEDRSGRNGDRIVDLGLIMLFCGIAGARLLSVVAEGHFMDFVNMCVDPKAVTPMDSYARGVICNVDAQCGADYLCDAARHACYPQKDCLEALKFWHGGLAYYGGFLFAVPVGLWYARWKKLGVMRIADVTSPMIALGLCFGRLGCFFNGCCFGRPSHLPWAMTFPGHSTPVHPTQLYESAGALAIFGVLYFVWRPRKRANGQVFAGLLILYGILRFMLEFLRDDERGSAAGLSTSQLIGIPLVLAGIAILWATRPARSQAVAA